MDSRLLGGNYGQYSGCRFCWRTSMMTLRYPMGICCLVSIFPPWNPLFFDDWMLKNLSGRSDCSSHVLPHAALPSTCGIWRQCGGAVSCESFVKLSMLGAQTLLQLMAAQAMHRLWGFCCALMKTLCHWLQTIIADILRPDMRAQCGDFGGRSPARLWHVSDVSVWRLMEVGGAVWGSSGHQGAAGVPWKLELARIARIVND